MTVLYYFVDPMCSWCYGFSSEMNEVINNLPDNIELCYIMGGLAPDSDEPMPAEMKQYVQHHWHTVAEKTGATFNFDFWTQGEPRRSTYPSCRAVITAGLQAERYKPLMLAAIQKAYYQQGRNPSENETLIEVAGEIGLDQARFADDLTSNQVKQLFETDLHFTHRLGVRGFPTLALEKDDNYYALTIGYSKADVVLKRFEMVRSGEIQA